MNPADAADTEGPSEVSTSAMDTPPQGADVTLSNLPWAITEPEDDRSLPPWMQRAVILVLILAAAVEDRRVGLRPADLVLVHAVLLVLHRPCDGTGGELPAADGESAVAWAPSW